MFDRLIAYLDSVRARDPAPRSRAEILLYPGVWALAFHRVAHWLFEGELQMTIGSTVHHLEAGDCLFMDLGNAFDFHNPGKHPARYAVILDRER